MGLNEDEVKEADAAETVEEGNADDERPKGRVGHARRDAAYYGITK